MYVDEVGNASMTAKPTSINERYLSLTGVITRLDHVTTEMWPGVEGLKQTHFNSHPDDPVVFHRKEMVNKHPPFASLQDPAFQANFNRALLDLLRRLEITVVTVVIDKFEHGQRYGQWASHPYHYCMEVLVERFCLFLEPLAAVGDVMAESRGGKEDLALKAAFRLLYLRGTHFVPARRVTSVLTSRELKMRQKRSNIAGLQLADMIAHPSLVAIRSQRMKEAPRVTFGGEIAKLLEESKYRRSPAGRTSGWGKVWLP